MSAEVQLTYSQKTQKELLHYGVLPAHNYTSVFLGVYKKFVGGLQSSILDKDDIISLCNMTYLLASQKYAEKVENEDYKGEFSSYLYVCCINRVYEEVNTNKVGVRVTKYSLSKMIKNSPIGNEHGTLLTTEDYVRSSLQKREDLTTNLTLVTTDIDKAHKVASDTDKEFIAELVAKVDTELEEKLIIFKYHQYTNEEIAQLLGVSPKYVSKKWVALKEKLKRRLDYSDISL